MDSVQVTQPSRPHKVVGWVEGATEFFRSVRSELAKVTWPTREELIRATRMIVVLSIVLGITIGLLDWMLQKILVDGVARLAR